jgi:hypothetical protein
MNKASCLSLLSNAVLAWNTMAIMKIVTQLRAARETIPDEDVARISPPMHQHVILTEPIISPVPIWETTMRNRAAHAWCDGPMCDALGPSKAGKPASRTRFTYPCRRPDR